MGAQIPFVDRATLTSVVRRAVGDDSAEVGDWQASPITKTFAPVTGGIYRLAGTARIGGRTTDWSVVLKVCHNPDRTRPLDLHADYWKREPLVYASGLLDDLPEGFRAPRCFGVEERSEDESWIWLEALSDVYKSSWPIERYGLAARQAGQLNGAYLARRPLPDVPWLQEGIARSTAELFGTPIELLPKFTDHPLVRRQWPTASTRERIVRLWRDRETYFAALARLPQTLCHLDYCDFNLFATRALDGRDETVAVDWQFVGTAAIGEELAPLVAASPVLGRAPAEHVLELGELAFDSYLAGLREAGWKGNAVIARLGYAAGMIRYAPAALGLIAVLDPAIAARAELTWGRSMEEILDRSARVVPYLLDLTDEARSLLESDDLVAA